MTHEEFIRTSYISQRMLLQRLTNDALKHIVARGVDPVLQAGGVYSQEATEFILAQKALVNMFSAEIQTIPNPMDPAYIPSEEPTP